MNEAQKNAIREADNYLKAACLPTYSALATSQPAPGVPEGWTVSAYKAAGLTVQSMAQLKGPDLWKIADASGNVLNKQGEWEWEPSPSNRDDAFLARCRYATLAEASAALAAARTTQKD